MLGRVDKKNERMRLCWIGVYRYTITRASGESRVSGQKRGQRTQRVLGDLIRWPGVVGGTVRDGERENQFM